MMEELIVQRLFRVCRVGLNVLIAGSFAMKREGHQETVVIVAATSFLTNNMYQPTSILNRGS
jgi:hypothetical protein